MTEKTLQKLTVLAESHSPILNWPIGYVSVNTPEPADREASYFSWTNYQLLSDDTVKKNHFILKSLNGAYFLSVATIEANQLDQEIIEQKPILLENLKNGFVLADEEAKQRKIEQWYDLLIDFPGELPDSVVQKIAEKKEQKANAEQTKQDDLLIAKVASDMGVSVEQFQRDAAVLYCMLHEAREEKAEVTEEKIKKDQEALECLKEKETETSMAEKKQRGRPKNTSKQKNIFALALEEMIDHNTRVKSKAERVHINNNSIRLWIKEHHGTWQELPDLRMALSDKTEQINQHNLKYEMNGAHNAYYSNYYKNFLKKWKKK